MKKQSVTAFSSTDNISVHGYLNTSGNATFTGGLNVAGSEIKLVSGIVGGSVNANTTAVKTNGGPFGGTVTLAGSEAQTLTDR